MKFRLGYVAISLTMDEIVHYHAMTYTSYLKLGTKMGNQKLENIIAENIHTLKILLAYNNLYNIHFYRISHHIIPLASHPNVKYNYIDNFKNDWLEIGKYIKENNMRIDSHPDQYCVLNSTRQEIVNSSINILKFNFKLFKALDIPGKTVLHVGSSVDGKEAGKNRFIENFNKLPNNIKKMIILENDDKIYTIVDVLELCEKLNIPFVLDYHHYLCNHGKEKITNYLPRIFATWKNTNLLPKIHFSSPKSQKEKRTHSTYISLKGFIKFLNIIKEFNQDVDIMLECKGKDEALFRLSKQLRMLPNIKYIDTSTFEIN